MELNTFFNHDTDEAIVHKKRNQELEVWISHLNYVTDESDWLAKIASNKLHNKTLRDSLLEKTTENSAFLNELYNYRSSIDKFNECDDMECDVYYNNLHDTYFNRYLKFIETYRNIKNELFFKILM